MDAAARAEPFALTPHARVLVVEDDTLQAESLAFLFRQDGYAVDVASTGAEGFARAQREPVPDVVVLDLGLPDVSGVEVARRLRRISDVPLLMLTARGETVDKIVGLDAGADDYMSKPFDTGELLARMRAVLRRRVVPRAGAAAPRVLDVGPLRLDPAKRRVTLHGELVALSAREFDILWLLAEAGGAAVPRKKLFAAIWGASFIGDERALDVYVRAIRRKIEPDLHQHRYLHTVRRVGYRLADEPPVPADEP